VKLTKTTLPSVELRSSKGAYVVHANQGRQTVQKWPRKRGKAKQGYDFYRQTEFAIAARWASHPEPIALQTATYLATGSDQVPRDILMMASMGTFYEFVLEDGSIVTGARMASPNAQWTLDQVTDVPGSMMYRAPIGWVGIAPGLPGQVLFLNAQGVPEWATIDATGSILSGTWTPTFTGLTTAPTGLTYSLRQGRYIADMATRLCWVNYVININNIGTGGAGSVAISGLPFAAVNTANQLPTSACVVDGVAIGAGFSQWMHQVLPNESRFRLYRVGTGITSAAIAFSAFGNSDNVRGDLLFEF